MNFAKIVSSLVTNIIVLESDPHDQTLIHIDGLTCSDGAAIQVGSGYNGSIFTDNNPVTTNLSQEYSPENYGQLVIEGLNATNISRNLTSAQLLSFDQVFNPYYLLLQDGDLQGFSDEISLLAVDGVLITNSLVASLKSQISTYLTAQNQMKGQQLST